MSAMVSQITGASIVYSTVCSGADQRTHQSSASLAFVRGIHRWPVNSSHKGPVTRKMFPFDDVIMTTNCRSWSTNVKIPLAPTTKIGMARVTLSFDLLTGKWSSPMGCICATNEYKYSLLTHCIKIKSPANFLLNEQYVLWVEIFIFFVCYHVISKGHNQLDFELNGL